jgi:hypothetical protein
MYVHAGVCEKGWQVEGGMGGKKRMEKQSNKSVVFIVTNSFRIVGEKKRMEKKDTQTTVRNKETLEKETKTIDPRIAPYTGEYPLKPVVEEEKENGDKKKGRVEELMESAEEIQEDFDYKNVLSLDKTCYRIRVVSELLNKDKLILVPRAEELEELDAKDGGGANWRVLLYTQIRTEELHPDNQGRHTVLVQTLGKIINKFLSTVKILSPGDVEKVMRFGGCISRLIALKPPKRDGKGREIIVTDGARRRCDYYYQVMVGDKAFMAREFRKQGIENEGENMERLERSGWIFHGIPSSTKKEITSQKKTKKVSKPSSSS